jgi:hypothetical protein
MPRKHTVWDAALGRELDIPFTAEEEVTRDAEEVAARAERDRDNIKKARTTVLAAKLVDDSITFDELKELMRLRG